MSLGHLTGSFMSGLLLSQFIFNVSLTVYVSKFIWKNGVCILYRDHFLNAEDMRDTQLNKINLYMIRSNHISFQMYQYFYEKYTLLGLLILSRKNICLGLIKVLLHDILNQNEKHNNGTITIVFFNWRN